MIGKSRCKFCEVVTPKPNELGDKVSKNETAQEIKELDNWKSSGLKRVKGRIYS